MAHPLDNPVHSSLAGPHRGFAERRGEALRYPVDVSPSCALPLDPTARDWADVGALVGPGAMIVLAADPLPPAGWEVALSLPGVQLVLDGVGTAPDDEAVRLTAEDVPDMLSLAGRTRPGPFLPRTIELGGYVGIRRHGELVAMAGERMHPPGWTEISAVCTDASQRGQGLAGRLVRAVAHGILARGETPFLHTTADNTRAIRLYESLGFGLRRQVTFQGVLVPAEHK